MNQKTSGSTILLLVLAVFSATAPLAIDMYLPGLPTLAEDLAATSGQVQQTISAFLLGFAIAPILWGPLSDRYGRKSVLYLGSGIFVLASVGAALSPSIEHLIAFRFVQAVGGSAPAVLARAIVRDRYDRSEGARMLSLLFMIMSVAPMLAPILGGQILVHLGWRWNFWALVVFGVLCLMLALYPLRETLPPERRSNSRPREMAASYATLLRSRRFVGYALCQALGISGMFAYIAGSPFVLIELFGVPPQWYGFLFGAHVLALLIGSFVNSRVVRAVGVDRMLLVGTSGVAVGGVLLLTAGVASVPLGGFMGAVVFYMLFVMLIGPNATAGALAEFPQIAGTASAFLGLVQFSLGAASGALVGLFHDGTAVPMTAVMMAGALLALASRVLIVGRAAPPAGD